MSNDRKIWNEFRKGSKDALNHIYFDHIKLLHRYGRKFTIDNELVKDTVQELFFELIRTRHKLGETDNIRFYLMKAFRRKLAKQLKKNLNQLSNWEDGDLPGIVYSAEEELIGKETLTRRERLVQQCLQELNPRQREILFYRFTCNLEYDEICDLMSLQYDSARKMVFRSLQSLKKLLTDISFFNFYAQIVKF